MPPVVGQPNQQTAETAPSLVFHNWTPETYPPATPPSSRRRKKSPPATEESRISFTPKPLRSLSPTDSVAAVSCTSATPSSTLARGKETRSKPTIEKSQVPSTRKVRIVDQNAKPAMLDVSGRCVSSPAILLSSSEQAITTPVSSYRSKSPRPDALSSRICLTPPLTPRPGTPRGWSASPQARELSVLDSSNVVDPITPPPSRRRRSTPEIAPSTGDRAFERVERLLKEKLESQQICGAGHLYIARAKNDLRLLKIGFTTGRPHDRVRQIGRKCGVDLEVFASFASEHCCRAEQLVHAELVKHQTAAPCACIANHKEWFRVDTTKATEVCRRWTSVMARRPYDGRGQLRGSAATKLRNCGTMKDIKLAFEETLTTLALSQWYFVVLKDVALSRAWPLVSIYASVRWWLTARNDGAFGLVCACVVGMFGEWLYVEGLTGVWFDILTSIYAIHGLVSLPGECIGSAFGS